MFADLFLFSVFIVLFMLPAVFRKEKLPDALYKNAPYAGGFVTSIKFLTFIYVWEQSIGRLSSDISFSEFSVKIFANFRPLVYGIIVRLILHQFVTEKPEVNKEKEQKDCRHLPYAELLSPREIEVARLASKGLTNAQIADELCISIVTVKRHLATIFKKSGITSRRDLTDTNI